MFNFKEAIFQSGHATLHFHEGFFTLHPCQYLVMSVAFHLFVLGCSGLHNSTSL